MTLSFRILLKLNIMDSQKAQKLPHDIGGGVSYEVDRPTARAVTGHVAEDSVCAAAAPRFRVKYRDMDWR